MADLKSKASKIIKENSQKSKTNTNQEIKTKKTTNKVDLNKPTTKKPTTNTKKVVKTKPKNTEKGILKTAKSNETKKTNDLNGKKLVKEKMKNIKNLTKINSKKILSGEVVSTVNNKPDPNKYVIELFNVKKSYITGDLETKVLKGVNIKLKKGQLIFILGPSGSGKTTLLNLISGLDKATEGDVFVLGNNLTLLKDSHLTKFRRDNVGFIFQQYNLLSNLNAKENAEVGENLAKKKSKDMSIKDIFTTIGMEDKMKKYPHQLSGGEQQRVSIARALAKNPDILFGDEPTGALDEEMGKKVLEILLKVNKDYKTTVIVVTHNPNIAKIGDVILHVRDGLIDKVIENKNPLKPSEIDQSK